MSWLMAGGTAATGIISGITGLVQSSKAKKLEKQNQRPTYQIPQEILKNQALAEQLSTTGIQGNEYNRATQNINRSAQAALDQATDRRGGLGAVGAIQQQKNDAFGNLGIEDTQQRLANIRNLMQQNQTLAGYRDKAFGYNEDQKYQENAAAIRALKGAGQANLTQGISGILGAGAEAFAGGAFKKGASIPKDVATGSLDVNSFMQNRPTIDQSLTPNGIQMGNAMTDQITNFMKTREKINNTPKDPTELPDFYSNGINSLNWLTRFKG